MINKQYEILLKVHNTLFVSPTTTVHLDGWMGGWIGIGVHGWVFIGGAPPHTNRSFDKCAMVGLTTGPPRGRGWDSEGASELGVMHIE